MIQRPVGAWRLFDSSAYLHLQKSHSRRKITIPVGVEVLEWSAITAGLSWRQRRSAALHLHRSHSSLILLCALSFLQIFSGSLLPSKCL